MVMRSVTNYSASWDVNDQQGVVSFYEEGDHITNVVTSSRDEFRLITDLLRNEKPVSFETISRRILVGTAPNREPVGEGEG